MLSQRVLTGPVLSSLESRAFERLAGSVGTQPESILYLGQRDHPQRATRERWREFGPSAALRIDTFDDLVTTCYQRDQYDGRSTHIDRPLLLRLVELGIEGISTATNPLSTGERFPSAGLVQEVETLFTDLEFAGLLSPDAMRRRLEAEGVPDRAAHVEELATAIETVRTETLADELPETYRTERMHHVTTAAGSLADAFPAVDAVVVSGFTRFDALERDLLERITETWPTVALLPLQVDADETRGIDTGTVRALETYHDLGFSRTHHVTSTCGSVDARRRLTQNLYRHPAASPALGDVDAAELNLTIGEPATVPDEVRTVARDIRNRLAAGTNAEELGVVLTSPVQYVDHVRGTFETYDLPFSLQAELPLPETAVGDAVQTICQLAREPRSVDSLLHLLTNPLVTATASDGPLDYRDLTRVAARAETNHLDSTLVYVDDAVATTIEDLLSEAAALSEAPIRDVSARVDALFDRLGVTAALAGERDLDATLRTRERGARDSLERVLETLELTASHADCTLGDSVDRLERALHGVSLRDTGRSADGTVVVCSLAEAVPRDFDHVYVLGLTSTHVPTDPEYTAFARPIYESHPDFERTDVAAEARYHFGTLLGSEASLHLSVPQRSVGGDPYVEADVLTELGRFVDRSTVAIDLTEVVPGHQEEVQSMIGELLGNTSEARARELIARAVQANTFDAAQESCIEAGVACAAARAGPELTPYDGQLDEETVARIHDAQTREPYSPSRLETYAGCGFKYYLQRVLGVDAPEPLTREPDPGARGSYLHDVFERYYHALQSTAGEPVHPAGNFETRQQRLLTIALDRLDEAFDDYSETAFQAEWLVKVLAGLGTAETNPYYGQTGEPEADEPAARGLLYRFLDHEVAEPGKTTARPTWFEARIGTPHDGGTPLQDEPARIDTPAGPVPIHGLIDRVEVVPDTEPTQLVVRDYKTGSTVPSERDSLLGQTFQLSLYALMAEDALDSVETVGGAYYQVSPPSAVSSRRGLLTSQEMAVYHGTDEVETPLLRHSYPHFETHAAFRRFVAETTSRRLGQLASGIEAGRFHPTVLDPSDAGCRYCEYAHVCDVRSHQRRDVIDAIDTADVTAYVPPRARGHEPADVVDGEVE